MQYRANIGSSYMSSGNGKTACTSPVIQARVRAGMTVAELVAEMAKAGAYNGGYLARATDICTEMFSDAETTRFVGFAGAMVPGGMGGIVEDLIRDGYVDVLVSTGANMTHDTIEAIVCYHYHGIEICDDDELYEEEINRIYDIYLPSDAFVRFEEFMQETLEELTDGTTLSISGLLRHIGEHLDTGILAAAAEMDIPIYCPAIQDSMIGLQYWLFNQMHKVTIDAFGDMSQMMDICFNAKKAGAFLIGGGVPKNYIFQSMLMTPKGFDYAVQLTGDRPDLGGLSGATLAEAKSWGKVTGEAHAQTVYGDATITLPLIIAAMRERIEHA